MRDYAQVKGKGKLTKEIVEKSLEMEQIDALGLDELDRSFLRALINVYDGGPAGINLFFPATLYNLPIATPSPS